MAFIQEKNKIWVIKAFDRGTRRILAWLLGNRDIATFKRLYDKVKLLKNCIFYIDDWDAFAAVLPAGRHAIGKKHTVAIEQNNSNTQHHLGRFTRRTKVVSKNPKIVDITLKWWHAMTDSSIFEIYRNIAFLSISENSRKIKYEYRNHIDVI